MESFNVTLMTIGCVSFLITVLAVFANNLRDRKQYHFELKPNCLLTRYPVVFVTGLSSVFYYRRYWNAFPSFLAEHGYEVFTLQLPWHGPRRVQKMKEFLQQQASENKTFHFVVDQNSEKEFTSLFQDAKSVLSVTVPTSLSSAMENSRSDTPTTAGFATRWAFVCHQHVRSKAKHLSVNDLGAAFPRGAGMLLERMRYLGEQDFLR